MPAQFDLVVTLDAAPSAAEFRLLDAHGAQLGYHRTDFGALRASQRQGMFDLRDYLRLHVEPGREADAAAEIGVCIAKDVLGDEIFQTIWQPKNQRTLRIRLPGAETADKPLAAALARVPWEVARPKPDAETLGERNLLVRIDHDIPVSPSEPLALAPDEPLRVLFVFAEARGSRPLAARQERRELLRLFAHEVYPKRRVVAHFLTHGVTRERLEEQIRQHRGYHVLHWSGHGHRNRLELARPGGAKDYISGGELLDLFAGAGGFLPRLAFLSACHSGDLVPMRDWQDFFARAQGEESSVREAAPEDRDLDPDAQPGFTGTAHALLEGGVPSVVAMRYAVGDDYARALAVRFYRGLLADASPKDAAAALAQARNALARAEESGRYAVCDHATPVLYGAEQPGLVLGKSRSPEAQPRDPRLHRIAELTLAVHEHFVGRTWELSSMGADFIGTGSGGGAKPVAVVTGLGGMGKTALVAEALDLWATRFDWILLYQAKPSALGFEATLRDIHLKLVGELGRYHAHVQQYPADAIYRNADAGFTGPARLARLTRNLIRALSDEAILLVLDNFETNLKPQPQNPVVAGQPAWACQDPAWDACLAALATDLVATPSRVLVTSRRPLAALTADTAHAVLLGPLPAGEAALYLRAHPALSQLAFGTDDAGKRLAQRLLNASRFHPLLMDRLARLAADPQLHGQLLQALETLEKSRDFAQLPALFATKPGDTRELAYLDDALAISLDQLIADAGPDARRLLWVIAVANDPVALGLLESVWNGESTEQARLRQLKAMLDKPSEFPPEVQGRLQALSGKWRTQLDTLPPAPFRPKLTPLLRHLVGVGLVTAERMGPNEHQINLTCHELVRERIHAWMECHPDDQGSLSENSLRLAYADWLKAYFETRLHEDMTAALGAGSQALVYCVQAEAWERLGNFAGAVVTGTNDPRLLTALIPHLQIAIESAPEGRPRWGCLLNLADALSRAGRPDAGITLYEQAASLARVTAEAGGDGAQQAWSDLAVITGNWANRLGDLGHLDAARQCLFESAEASTKAGDPVVNVIARELEVLRIDIIQGRVETALPEVETRLVQVRQWWERHCADQTVPEALNAEMLVRVFIGALDIAADADAARKNWTAALGRVEEILQVKRALERPDEDIGATRFNRATVLLNLERLTEARAELEDCLDLFQNRLDWSAKVHSSLASLWRKCGDVNQAVAQERRALALRENLPDPADRAISHNNLAAYLYLLGAPAALAEVGHHRLAAFAYHLVANLGQALQTTLHNYAVFFRRARDAGTVPAVPRVAELLADPAFAPLGTWLNERQADAMELQTTMDRLLDQLWQTILQSK